VSTAGKAAWRNALVLVVVVLAAWQLLYWSVGDIALRSPAATFAYMRKLFSTDTFWVHFSETARAFVLALVLPSPSVLRLAFSWG
jgi:NitT/TauT family transport system permease protein